MWALLCGSMVLAISYIDLQRIQIPSIDASTIAVVIVVTNSGVISTGVGK